MSKIDAMVAERVMGWKPCSTDCTGGCFWQETNGPVYRDNKNGGGDLFSPSTDPAAMMVVVEKMRADGIHFSCGSPYRAGDVVAKCWAKFGGTGDWPVTANTLPLAVCLAALRAVGTPESEIERSEA